MSSPIALQTAIFKLGGGNRRGSERAKVALLFKGQSFLEGNLEPVPVGFIFFDIFIGRWIIGPERNVDVDLPEIQTCSMFLSSNLKTSRMHVYLKICEV